MIGLSPHRLSFPVHTHYLHTVESSPMADFPCNDDCSRRPMKTDGSVRFLSSVNIAISFSLSALLFPALLLPHGVALGRALNASPPTLAGVDPDEREEPVLVSTPSHCLPQFRHRSALEAVKRKLFLDLQPTRNELLLGHCLPQLAEELVRVGWSAHTERHARPAEDSNAF